MYIPVPVVGCLVTILLIFVMFIPTVKYLHSKFWWELIIPACIGAIFIVLGLALFSFLYSHLHLTWGN